MVLTRSTDVRETIKIGIIITVLFITFLIATGCDEAGMMKPVVPVDTGTEPTEPTTNGEVKQPEEPTEPVEPEPTPEPTVTEVGWYSEWELKQSVNNAQAGDTLYIKVVFSAAVEHIVADDATARPAIVLIVNDMATQFHVVASGASLQNGDCKPLKSGTDDYICRYTVPIGAADTLTLQVNGTTVSMLDIIAPTISITATVRADDGSITVSGTSINVPEGSVVTVTVADTVTATTVTDNAGAWTVTVPKAQAETLPTGTAIVTATTKDVVDTSSLVIPEPLSEEEEWQKKEEQWRKQHREEYEQYNFSEETTERLVDYRIKKYRLSRKWQNDEISEKELRENLNQLYEEAYGISREYAFVLLKIYVEERPEEEYLFGGWDISSVGIAYPHC